MSDQSPPPERPGLGRSAVAATTGAVRGTVRGTVVGGKAFTRGTTAVARGVLRLIRTPGLWPYGIAPVACGLLVCIAILVFLMNWLLPLSEQTAREWLGDWSGPFAWWISFVALAVAFVVAFYVAFPSLVRVVAAPFLALLADKVFEDVSGLPAPTPPGNRFVRWILRPIWEAVVLLAVRLVVMVVALPLLCVPVAGPFLFLGVLLPVEGLDLLDLAQSARAVPLGERLRFVLRNPLASAGLGIGAAGVLLIPFVNVFLLPALVVGAVLLDRDVAPDFPLAETASPPPEEDAA